MADVCYNRAELIKSMNNGTIIPSIIDVEASGFGSGSYPVEIGVALACGTRLSQLICPESDWTHWDQEAEQCHGLTRRMLMHSGKPIADVADEFNELLRGQTVYSDAWSVDKPWISTLFHSARVPMQFAVSPIEQIMKEEQFEIWDSTKRQLLHHMNGQRHRASYDAYIIQTTFTETRLQSRVSNTAYFGQVPAMSDVSLDEEYDTTPITATIPIRSFPP